MATQEEAQALPGANLDMGRMPGHWLLARLGKRVLRPGGLELTERMLAGLAISTSDDVIEFAPGLGTTTRMVLGASPASYTGIERDAAAASSTRRVLRGSQDRCLQGIASETGLDPASGTVVFGEAMLTMQSDTRKAETVREARRILRPGGRYGIHELALMPDDLPAAEKAEVQKALSDSIHVGARPLTVAEWRQLLEREGFEVISCSTAPMHLLRLGRLIADEGLLGATRVIGNVLRLPAARRRVLEMRAVFQEHAPRMCAVAIVARKVETVTS